MSIGKSLQIAFDLLRIPLGELMTALDKGRRVKALLAEANKLISTEDPEKLLRATAYIRKVDEALVLPTRKQDRLFWQAHDRCIRRCIEIASHLLQGVDVELLEQWPDVQKCRKAIDRARPLVPPTEGALLRKISELEQGIARRAGYQRYYRASEVPRRRPEDYGQGNAERLEQESW